MTIHEGTGVSWGYYCDLVYVTWRTFDQWHAHGNGHWVTDSDPLTHVTHPKMVTHLTHDPLTHFHLWSGCRSLTVALVGRQHSTMTIYPRSGPRTWPIIMEPWLVNPRIKPRQSGDFKIGKVGRDLGSPGLESHVPGIGIPNLCTKPQWQQRSQVFKLYALFPATSCSTTQVAWDCGCLRALLIY